MNRPAFSLSSLVALSLALACGCGGREGPSKPAQDPGATLVDTTSARPKSSGPSAQSPDVTKGVKALEDGRYDEAREAFASAVKANARDLEANYYLAVAYDRLGERKAAETYYRKALAISPGDSGASANLSALMLEDNRPDEAISVLRESLKTNAQSEKLHFNLARALAAKKDVDGATAEFEKTLAINGDPPDYHLAYGQFLATAGKQDAAVVQVRLAYSTAKDDLELLSLVGHAFRLLRQPKECVEVFDKVIAQRAAPAPRTERGLCKMALKDGPGAEADLRAAITADQNTVPAHYWLGVLLAARGEKKGAAAEFDTVLRLDASGEMGQRAQTAKASLNKR